jgi:hypothetical protein
MIDGEKAGRNGITVRICDEGAITASLIPIHYGILVDIVVLLSGLTKFNNKLQ